VAATAPAQRLAQEQLCRLRDDIHHFTK